MHIDVQNDISEMYKKHEFDALKYIYFDVFDEKCEDIDYIYKEIINHSIEKYPEIANLLLLIKNGESCE